MSPRLEVSGAGAPETLPAPDLPTVDVARERPWAVAAGAAALASVVLTMASLLVQAGDLPRREDGPTNDRTQLIDVGGGGTGQEVAVYLRAASLLLVVGMVWFVFRAVRGRNPLTASWIPWLGTVAFMGVAAFQVLGFYEVRDLGREFLASGPQTLARAEDLLDDARSGGMLRTVNVGSLVTALISGVWISLGSYEAMRVGLLTRFLGVFGIGAGLATAISFPIGPYLFLGWLGSLALLAIGLWPGGRPLAWDAGRAVSLQEADAAEHAARVARRERRSR